MFGIAGWLAAAWAGDPKEIRSAYDAGDTERWLRLSTEATLAARAAKTEQEVVQQIERAVAAADGRPEGFEGVLLSAVTEAWERGVSAATLRDALGPLAGVTPAPAEDGEPAFVPVGSTSGYGARFVRLAAARAAVGDLLLDPTGSLSSHFGESLCDQDPAALEAQLGATAAAQVRAMCDGGGHHGDAGDLLGGPTLGLLSDFDCVLGQSQTPSFDQQIAQAALDCLQSEGADASNPIADGADSWFVAESETKNPDGSRTYQVETADGSWSSRTEREDGSWTQLVYHTSNDSTAVIDVTASGEFRVIRLEDGVMTVEESDGYAEACVDCPEAHGAQQSSSADSAACVDLMDQVYEHIGKTVPAVGDPRPDHVSFPSPDVDPESDADRCLDGLGAFEPAATSSSCGLQYCPFGEAPDPAASCVCRPLAGANVEDLTNADCAHQLNCVEGTATSVGGVCACPEPGQPDEPPGRWPGVDDGSTWRW
ncbi:MAG: hypothetical protein ABMA64_33135 [Myxococcota bacterium]